MADNIRATPSTGTTGALFASDEMVDPLGSTDVVHVPLSKLVYGVANSGTPVSTNNPWPVTVLASTILTANVTNTVVVNVTNTVTVNVTNTVVANVTNTVVVDSELPAAAAMSDNAANPTVPAVAAHLMVWDSTAWDRLLGSSVDGVLVNLGANNDVTLASTANVSGSTVHLGTGTNNIGTVNGSSVSLNGITSDAGLPVRVMSSTTITVTGTSSVTVATALPTGTNNIGTVNGSSVTLNGVSSDAGLAVRIMGSTTLSVSGSTISVSGSTISVSGSSVSLNGITSDAGLPVRVMSSTTITVTGTSNISGSTVSVVNGSTFLVQPQAYASGGADPHSFITTTAAVSTGVPVKASAGQVYTVDMFNTSSTPVYVRLYNQTTTPASTDDANIKWRGIVPGSTAGAGFVKAWPLGLAFGTGIGIRWSAGVADTDTTVLTSSPTYGNVGYK